MLDWLSYDQRATYAETSQIFDAPETPAPFFAYRALKSVLFGSHEDEYGDDDEKENIPLETRSPQLSIDSQKSSLKPKSSTPPRPTPRQMLSPAKSILRTPGIPTPRRHNVSVKFKDIKPTSTTLNTIVEAPRTEEKANSPKLKHPAIFSAECQASADQTTESRKKSQTAETRSESEPEIYYNVMEIDTYITATEREMKRLVRYGQRMREYARLSQKENVTLKRDLVNARKENERLRRGEYLTISQGKAGRTAENEGLFDLSPSSRDTVEAAAQVLPKGERRTLQEALEDRGQHLTRTETLENKLEKQPSPRSIKLRIEEVSASTQADRVASIRRISATSQYPAQKTRVVSRTQLPPDKLAAAKARLRVKSEERRKALNMADDVQKEDHGSSAVDRQDL